MAALRGVEIALADARREHGNMKSAHEALAVIREEYLEVEREIFAKQQVAELLRRELTHLAAMCVRAIEDLEL